MDVMDECLLRRARAGRGWALDEVTVAVSVCDSMVREQREGSAGRVEYYLRGRTSGRSVDPCRTGPETQQPSRNWQSDACEDWRAPRYVRTDEPSRPRCVAGGDQAVGMQRGAAVRDEVWPWPVAKSGVTSGLVE